MIFLSLFITFFKIGLFGFGGGYGMLSLIQHETVESHHWLSTAEFTDIVAISQMTPGPIGINSATYWLLCNEENFSTPKENPWQFFISCALLIATAVGTGYLKINPIRMICYAGIAGLLLLY